jgi:hypothetical protein
MEGDLVTVEGIQHSDGRQGEAGGVPSGSTLDRGMREQKRTDDRSSTGGTLNSGGPESCPEVAARLASDGCDQRKEDAVLTLRESDPPIVVRDGSTGHTAKGWAGGQRKQRYLHGTRLLPVYGVKLPACNGNRFWHSVSELVPSARLPEEPGAVIPHAGICEGGAR